MDDFRGLEAVRLLQTLRRLCPESSQDHPVQTEASQIETEPEVAQAPASALAEVSEAPVPAQGEASAKACDAESKACDKDAGESKVAVCDALNDAQEQQQPPHLRHLREDEDELERFLEDEDEGSPHLSVGDSASPRVPCVNLLLLETALAVASRRSRFSRDCDLDAALEEEASPSGALELSPLERVSRRLNEKGTAKRGTSYVKVEVRVS